MLNKKGRINYLFFILFFGLALVISACQPRRIITFNAAEKEWLQNKETQIEILFGYDAPPEAFHNDEGEYVGLLVDFFYEIESLMETDIVFRYFDTWDELIEYAKTGKNFIIVGIAHTNERTAYLSFTDPFLKIPYVIITQKNSDINSMLDLYDKEVCTIINYAVNDYLALYYPDVKTIDVIDDFEGLQMVYTGECDAMIISQMSLSFLIEEQAITNLRVAGESGYVNRLSAATSINDPMLFNILDKAVDQLSPAKKDELYRKWVNTGVSGNINQSTLIMFVTAAGIGILVLLLLWIWSLSLQRQVHIQTEEIRQSKDRFESLITKAPISIGITDQNQNIIFLNDSFTKQFGYTLSDLKTENDWWSLAYPDEAYRNTVKAGWQQADKQAAELGTDVENQEWNIRTKDNKLRTVDIRKTQLGDLALYIFNDMTEKKRAADQLRYIATHDDLTGLPNRLLINDRIEHACILAKRLEKKTALFFLDLDGFKNINDAYGHEKGDWLLKHLAQRLKMSIRDSDTVARLGGDEFAVLLEQVANIEDVIPIAEKIISVITDPFTINGSEAFITASIGISIYPDDGHHASELLQKADTAMYTAKEKGKHNYQFYSEEMETQISEQLEIRSLLRYAIQANELVNYYQPIYDARTGEAIGVESLIRWQHPRLGLMTPGQFLDQAEETGLILPIGEQVLSAACAQMKTWLDTGQDTLSLYVNISGPELRRSDLVEMIANTLEKSSLPANKLTLELSENIVFHNLERALPILQQIKELGVRIAIDDFGVGYSTLAQLAYFPFDDLKIDKSFASSVTHSSKDAAIVKGIITIAQNLGLNVIAEGIENQSEVNFYASQGCHLIQGYVYSKPEPAEAITKQFGK